MKRQERNQDSKPSQQQQVNVPLLRAGDCMNDRCFMQMSDVETALGRRKTLIKEDEPDQQNDTAEGKADRDFPCRTNAIAGAPNANEEKGRSQCEFVKSVKEKQVD